VPGRRAFKCHW